MTMESFQPRWQHTRNAIASVTEQPIKLVRKSDGLTLVVNKAPLSFLEPAVHVRRHELPATEANQAAIAGEGVTLRVLQKGPHTSLSHVASNKVIRGSSPSVWVLRLEGNVETRSFRQVDRSIAYCLYKTN